MPAPRPRSRTEHQEAGALLEAMADQALDFLLYKIAVQGEQITRLTERLAAYENEETP